MTRPLVLSSSTAAQENGSEQQLGVRKGCLLSPTLFNIFLERIMKDALEDHEGTVSTEGRTITNLHFADDIDGLAAEEEELAKLVKCLNKASTAYGMEISAKKTELMTNNTNGINTEIKVNGQKLETVTSFKHLGSVTTNEGSKPDDTLKDSSDNCSIDKVDTSLEWQEYFSEFQDMTDALPCNIHLAVCLWIMDSHSQGPKKNTSHGKEVLLQDTTHLIQQVTNKEVRAKIQQAIRPHEDLLTIVKRHKLQWYGQAKTILQGTVKGGRRQGRQRKWWEQTSGNGQAWSSRSPRGQ